MLLSSASSSKTIIGPDFAIMYKFIIPKVRNVLLRLRTVGNTVRRWQFVRGYCVFGTILPRLKLILVPRKIMSSLDLET